MSKQYEPNPPTRREGDFPKTTTIPDGWVTDGLMEVYNGRGAVPQRDTRPMPDQIVSLPATGGGNGKVNGHANGHSNGNGKAHSPVDEETTAELFTRRLDPFPSPGDAFGMWL